jgi:hypothetical protein
LIRQAGRPSAGRNPAQGSFQKLSAKAFFLISDIVKETGPYRAPVGPPRRDPDILTLPGTGGSRVRKFMFCMNFHMAHFCFMNFSTEKNFPQEKIQNVYPAWPGKHTARMPRRKPSWGRCAGNAKGVNI